MERERWAQVKQILSRYLDLQSGERASYLAHACAGDPLLLEDVQSMLNSHDALGDFLETPIFKCENDGAFTGSLIGNYLLREPIAEGGMGTVYRAVRSADFETVAIKLVKRGMDTDFILRRFRRERQILAALDHPNIARLLDGGATEDGRPYLVMEYVEGKPITDYSDEHALPLAVRLELFRTVCSAVQFAHQNLVVHRDLKPSNILVTPDGVSKLLDFGIAKLLQPDSDATSTSVRLLTPECASPEQVRGQSITTASDIYSLGVLLYHLLTGERPYQFTTRTPQEVARVVCESEPKRPSALRPIPSDLDNIVLKAMQKEPARRYVSAEQLSEDIQRFLQGLPVSARKDTYGYRAKKFVGRHKAATVAVAGVALLLTAGIAATLWEAHVAKLERTRAERRFNDVRDLAHSVIFELHDAIKELPGSTPARKLLIERGVHYLDTLAKESADDPSLQHDIASAYERVGLVQGQYGAANLGDAAGALQSIAKALDIRQSIARKKPASSNDLRELAGAYRLVSTQLLANGSPSAALTEIQKATEISQDLARRSPGDNETLSELAADYDAYGLIQGGSPGSLGDVDGAAVNFGKAVAINEALLRNNPLGEDTKGALERNYVHLGTALSRKGSFQECIIDQQKSLEFARELAAGSSSSIRGRDVAVAYNHLADCYEGLGDLKQTLASYVAGRKIYLDLASGEPRNATMQSGLAVADLNVGSFLTKTGHTHEGLALMDDGVQIKERLVAADPANFTERSRLAQFYKERSEARERRGMLAAALSDSQKALTSWQLYAAQDVRNASAQVDVARYQLSVARLSTKMGLSDQAEANFRNVLRYCGKDAGGNRANFRAQRVAAEAYSGLANIATVRGSNPALGVAQRVIEVNAARSLYQKSLDLWRSIGKPDTSVNTSHDNSDSMQVAQGIADCDRQLSRLRAQQFQSRRDR
jgi:tetratricopeptide (TPR) repeat protein